MSAKTYTVFDEKTRQRVSFVTCQQEHLPQHVKNGQIAIDGRWPATRLNDDGQPEHDAERMTSAERERRRTARLSRIEELERKQARRVRELLAASDPKLSAMDDEIAALRAQL